MKRCKKGFRRVNKRCRRTRTPARRSRRVYAKCAKGPRGKKCRAKNKVSRFRRRSNRIRRDNAIYDRMSTSEKGAYLKRKLPWMDASIIDANSHLYGYRRRRNRR